MLKEILYQCVVSLASSITFAIISHVPKGTLLQGGIIGMLGWLGYWACLQKNSTVFLASFVCALILAVASYIAAILYKKPMIVFFVPGLVPVVPGITFFEAFLALIQGDYPTAGRVFLDVIYISVGIASGLLISYAFFQIYQMIRHKRNAAS